MTPTEHQCVRVYANGTRVVERRSPHQLNGWLEHNKLFRFGNALFVDGVCHANGYLSVETCNGIAAELKASLDTSPAPATSVLPRRKFN